MSAFGAAAKATLANVAIQGKPLAAPPELVSLFTAFYEWDPIPPRTPK